MSDLVSPLNQTVTLAVMAIVSGTNSRRTEFSSRVGLNVDTKSQFDTIGLNPSDSIAFGTFTQLFALMADNPVTVVMVIGGVTTTYASTTMLVINSPFTSVTITNNGSITAHARLAFVS